MISPFTQEKVKASDLQKHVKYQLIDPNWKDEREKQIQQKKAEDEVYAAGNLKKINTYCKNISHKSCTSNLFVFFKYVCISFYISLLHKNIIQFNRLFLSTIRVFSNVFIALKVITNINIKNLLVL